LLHSGRATGDIAISRPAPGGGRGRLRRLPEPALSRPSSARVQPAPLVVAVAHSKGGVGKTTTTLILGRYLARAWRVALLDYDESAHLTYLIAEMASDRRTLTRRLWLQDGETKRSDIVLIDAAPSRGPDTRRALVEADYVLIPAPPERMAVRAMLQMLDTVAEVRAHGNPYLTVLGVVPTMYDVAWPDHRLYLEQMRAACAARGVRLFPPIARRHSYLSLSTAGQDYRPIADAIGHLVGARIAGG
jgi:cellulose biosynthesis protein BcsQ